MPDVTENIRVSEEREVSAKHDYITYMYYGVGFYPTPYIFGKGGLQGHPFLKGLCLRACLRACVRA
jgi:hypothetical protein